MSRPKFSPGMPSLEELGLSRPKSRPSSTESNMISDGRKRVNYRPTTNQSVRPFQSNEPVIGTPTTGKKVPVTSAKTPTTKSSALTKKTPLSGATREEKWKGPYPTLKITPYGETIAGYILEFPVLAVDFPTGTGKTRYLPYLLATKGYRVRVAIPTTVAVRDAFQFQRKYSNLQVGYAAGREVHYSPNDQLIYATTGHFTSKILAYIKSGRVRQQTDEHGFESQMNLVRSILGDIFFIDEVHTSTSQITVLIGLLRYLFPDENNRPRIVFSTATFNHGDIMDHFPDFPVYQQTELEYAHPVTDIYLTEKRDPLKDDPNDEIIRIVREELESFKRGTPSNAPQKVYHGIVFRPGIEEVTKTIEALEREFPLEEPVVFFPAYSGLTKAEIDEIYAPSEVMKVVVGTNIFESSVTVDDVGFVIDDGLEKIAETSATGGHKLALKVISQASGKQRRGRTGRTIEGRYYPLMTQGDFDNLEKFRPREIDRVPIYDIVLQLMEAELDVIEVLKINPARYDQARRVLINFGMIEARGSQYAITEAGRFVSSIPLSVQNAYMIYLSYQTFVSQFDQGQADLNGIQVVLRTAIAAASMLEVYGPSFFFVPRRERGETKPEYAAREEAHIKKYHDKFRGPTDIHTLVNIFWDMMSDINVAKQYDQASRYKIGNYLFEWAEENSMNHKKMKEFFNVFQDIESMVESKISADPALATVLPVNAQNLSRSLVEGGYEQLGTQIAEIFSRAYSVNRFFRDVKKNGRPVYKDRNGVEYQINRHALFNTIIFSPKKGPGEIIAAQTIEVAAQRQVNLAGLIISQDYFSPELEPLQRPVRRPKGELPLGRPKGAKFTKVERPAKGKRGPITRYAEPVQEQVKELTVSIPTPLAARPLKASAQEFKPLTPPVTAPAPLKIPSTLPPTTLPSTTKLPPTTLPSTAKLPPTTLPSTTKLPPTTLPSTAKLPPTTLPSTTKLPPTTLPSTAKLPPTTLPSTTKLPPTTLPSTTKLPPTTLPSTTKLPPTTLPSTTKLPSTTLPPTTPSTIAKLPSTAKLPPLSLSLTTPTAKLSSTTLPSTGVKMIKSVGPLSTKLPSSGSPKLPSISLPPLTLPKKN